MGEAEYPPREAASEGIANGRWQIANGQWTSASALFIAKEPAGKDHCSLRRFYARDELRATN